MELVADQILEIIKDYQNDFGIHLSREGIIEWVNQFDAQDRQFVLEEFLHVLNHGIYCSKEKAELLCTNAVLGISRHLKYNSPHEFLVETQFLNLQPAPKSQGELLAILDLTIQKEFGIGLKDCGSIRVRNYVYFDDIIATGGTLLNKSLKWLLEEVGGVKNFSRVNAKEIRLIISVFCAHTWAIHTIKWLWKYTLNNDDIMKNVLFFHHYEIQNQIGVPSERLNLTYPEQNQPQDVKAYFDGLEVSKHEAKAFRRIDQPLQETFFSSAANRCRIEGIFLKKGVGILNKVQQKNKAHRPLGCTFPNYKTLGTGTIYFTWRNVSNTCPIVFWWQGHGWKGLFPLRNRGVN